LRSFTYVISRYNFDKSFCEIFYLIPCISNAIEYLGRVSTEA